MPAQLGQPPGGGGVGGQLDPAGDRTQQPDGGGLPEHPQGEPLRAGQGGQRAAARDHHRAAVPRGDERLDLGLVRGVVQQHQHAPVGQVGAEHLGALVQAVGNGRSRHAEGAQEPAERVRRLDRFGSGAAQVHVQPAVGEGVPQVVGGLQGQRALAHPRHAGDGADHRSGGGAVAQDGEEPAQFGVAPGEVAHSGGEQGRGRRRGRRDRGRGGRVPLRCRFRAGVQVDPGIPAQDGLFQRAQLRSRFQAQLLGQDGTGAPVGLQRLRTQPGPVHRHHQPRGHGLHQRILRDHREQFGDDLRVPAQRQVGVDALGQHPSAVLLQAFGRLRQLGHAVQSREGPAVPQRERLPLQDGRRLRLPPVQCPPGALGQVGEVPGVDLLGPRGQRVARAVVPDPLGDVERPAQPVHEHLQVLARAGSEPLAPQRVDQGLCRHDAPSRADEERQQLLLPA